MNRRQFFCGAAITFSNAITGCVSLSDNDRVSPSYSPGDPVIMILRNGSDSEVTFDLFVEEIGGGSAFSEVYSVESDSVTETEKIGEYGNEYLIEVSANGAEKATEMAFDRAGGPQILFADGELDIHRLQTD